VSTTTKPNYAQPAFIGGLVMGVLSALPLVSAGNLCCCLWVVCGGGVAAYLLQQNQSSPITPGDGALVGLLAGLIGAVVQMLVGIPIGLLVAPMERAMLQRVIDAAGSMPPELRDTFERFSRADAEFSISFFILRRVFGLFIWMFVGGIFSTIGGLLGAVIFKKSLPPGVIDAGPTTL
jgi:hypothetical protein